MPTEKLNPIKIASIIFDPREKSEVEKLIALYRKEIINDIEMEVVNLRNGRHGSDVGFVAFNHVIKLLQLYK